MPVRLGVIEIDVGAIYRGAQQASEIYLGGVKAWPPEPAGFDWANLIPGALTANLADVSVPATGPAMTQAGSIFALVTFAHIDADMTIARSGGQNTSTPGLNALLFNTTDALRVQIGDGVTRLTSNASGVILAGVPLAVRVRWQAGGSMEADWTSDGVDGGALARDVATVSGSLGTTPFTIGDGLVGAIHRIVFYNQRADDTQWASGLAALLNGE